MHLQVKVFNEITPFLQQVTIEKPKWYNSSLKSAGYWSQQEIKKGIESGAPGGRKYAKLMLPRMRRRLEKALGYNTRGKKYNKPLGRLVQAVGYDKTKADRGIVTVGWLSRTAADIGSKHEKGFFTQVTERVRKAFNIAGLKLASDKTQITVRKRPTFTPMLPIIQRGARRVVEMKLIDYMRGVSQSSKAASKRKYQVYQ